MTELARVAVENDVILLHENEKEIYGSRNPGAERRRS